MPSTYTTNKIYELQATGENIGTWGTLLNAVLSILDLNLGGRLALNVAGAADVNLTAVQERNAYILMTGILTGNINVVFQTAQGGFFLLDNRSTGAFTITAKPSGGTGVVVPQGSKCLVMVDPTNTRCVLVGTPQVLTTRGDMIYQDASGVQRLPVGAQGSVLKTGASDPGWLAPGTAGQFLKSQGAAADPIWGSLIPSGTLMLFQQTAAPTGWTKQATHNDKALRVVSGAVGSGGSVAFSTLFGRTAVDSHILTIAEMPAHDHTRSQRNNATAFGAASQSATPTALGAIVNTSSTGPTGGDGGHVHNIDMRVQYVDLIIASKDA